jgi:hypothetical protein
MCCTDGVVGFNEASCCLVSQIICKESTVGIERSDEQPNCGERKDTEANKDTGSIGILRHNIMKNGEMGMENSQKLKLHDFRDSSKIRASQY